MTGEVAALAAARDWLNSPRPTVGDLEGKIVVVSFWTYTCINWIRTIPYLREWSRIFADHNVVVIGVHTPEFSFEADVANIRRESQNLGVEYPIVVDSDYAIWQAFDNHYWPALYVIDTKGEVVHRHFGEGEYERSEQVIRQLIGEPVEPSEVVFRSLEFPADWEHVRSPETYVGGARGTNRVSLDDGVDRLRLNQWGLTGDWSLQPERVVLERGSGQIAYAFHARDVNLVMGTGSAAVPFRVLLDGRAPRASHGLDVDINGRGVVSNERMYQLVRLDGPGTDTTLELEFAAPGVRAYVFTFG